MTDTCTCPPDDCHGGHTITVGLPLPTGWPDGPTDEVLGELLQAAFVARSPAVAFVDETASPACTGLRGTFDLRHIVMAMAGPMRDLIAPHFAQVTRERDEARARVAELEVAQREPIGYAVVTTYLDGRWVQTAPVVSLDAARARARVHAEHDARVVELREVP